MKPIADVTQFSESIMPVMLDAGLKSFLILAVGGIAVLLLRKASAATRHLVWLLAVVSVLLLPVLSAALPGWRVLPRWLHIVSGQSTTEWNETFVAEAKPEGPSPASLATSSSVGTVNSPEPTSGSVRPARLLSAGLVAWMA